MSLGNEIGCEESIMKTRENSIMSGAKETVCQVLRDLLSTSDIERGSTVLEIAEVLKGRMSEGMIGYVESLF